MSNTSHNLVVPAYSDPVVAAESLFTHSARQEGQRLDTNVIYCGDNLEVLPKYVPDESVDLIYIDPPFNTSRDYEVFWGETQEKRAFEDRYGDAMTYLDWMRPRLQQLYRVLKPTGSFYYHCDWHASHYIKVELDQLFGFNNFRNEIIWQRTSSHNDSKKFGQVSDSIFYYSKSEKVIWNPQFTDYDPTYVANFYRYKDERGQYRLDHIIRSETMGLRPNLTYEYKRFTPPWGWRVTLDKLKALDKDHRLEWSSTGRPYLKRYLHEMKGTPVKNIWTDIPPVGPGAAEKLGYPTQKPLALLQRILQASSNPGDVVLDAFCGCGTTLDAAARLTRNWVGIDFSPTACRVMASRLENLGLEEGKTFRLMDMPRSPEQLRLMPHFEFQNWAVIALGGIPNRVKTGDFGIDGRLYPADRRKERGKARDLFGEIDNWYPIQVKQREKVGREDIDSFETALRRDRRHKGYFVAFGFTDGAVREMKRAYAEDGLEIVEVTVDDILRQERLAVAG